MASVLEYVLSGELDVDTLVSFLKKDTGNDGFVCKVSHGSANLLLQKGGGGTYVATNTAIGTRFTGDTFHSVDATITASAVRYIMIRWPMIYIYIA